MKISAKYWNIEFFNGFKKRYGGHSQWLSMATGLDYLMLTIMTKWQWGYMTEYYDGFHHYIALGKIGICWGGPPYNARQDFAEYHNGLMFKICSWLDKHWSLP